MGVLFDLEKIDWEYEREGYQLPSGWYVPDFWLPQVGMWAEVKPSTFSGIERLRCDELARVTEFPVILLAGAPSNIAYEILDHAGRYMDRVCSINGGYLDERRFWACNSAEAEERLNDDTETHKAAKAHRFDWRSH